MPVAGNIEGCRGEPGSTGFGRSGEVGRPTRCWCWEAVSDSSGGESGISGLSDIDDTTLTLLSSIPYRSTTRRVASGGNAYCTMASNLDGCICCWPNANPLRTPGGNCSWDFTSSSFEEAGRPFIPGVSILILRVASFALSRPDSSRGPRGIVLPLLIDNEPSFG